MERHGKAKPNEARVQRSANPEHAATAKVKRDDIDRGDGWAELASFVVTFESREKRSGRPEERRVTAHRMEGDGITAAWTGDAQDNLCAWMSAQVPDWRDVAAKPSQAAVLPGTSPESTPPYGPASTAKERLAIASLEVQRCSSAGATRSDRDFDVQALVVAAPENDGAADAGACTVQFFCRNMSTSETIPLGKVLADRERNANRFRARMHCAGLSAGTYRIESTALLLNARDLFAYRRGPLFELR